MKPLMIRHLEGEAIGRFPVWMMRQAGRYLPSYRAIRAKHTFWETVTDPVLAKKVSLLPLEELPVDGVILFSDILTLPYGLGIEVEMKESVGPVVPSPLSSESHFAVFEKFAAGQHTPFVGETLSALREEIPADVALLGFAGAPWTVGCYLIEGKGKTHFERVKQWLQKDPSSLKRGLESLGRATLNYLKYQHQQGAHIVQVFDTWLSEMPRSFFLEYYLPVLNQIFRGLKEAKIPSIYFTKRAYHLLEDFVQLEVDTLSVDELLPLHEVERRTQGKFSLQGNLDPVLLLGEQSVVRRATRELVNEARNLHRPPILNLGHGVLPGASVENVKAFFEEARALWV